MRRGCFAPAQGSPACAWHSPIRCRAALVRRVALALGGPGFYVEDWTQDHANFFRSIEITKSMMFVILLMLVAVAAFNIVATLVMIVKEKQTDIAILRTLGAAPRNVLLTFAMQGVLHRPRRHARRGGARRLLAANLETLVAALERLLGTQFLDARVYYMSDLPAYVEVARRAARLRRGVPAVRAGDALPGLARRAHGAGGGAAP